MRSNIVGQPERTGEIVEVRGAGGELPAPVRSSGQGHDAELARRLWRYRKK